MTTYTSSLRLTDQDTGGNENTWGDIADTNFQHIDDAIAGQVSVDLTGSGSHTLTVNNGVDDEARNASLFIHGTPTSANSVIIPATEKQYIVRATHTSVLGGITVRTNTGTGVTFEAGTAGLIYCDGVSAELVANVTLSALDPSNNLSDVADASASRENLGLEPDGTYLFTSGTKLDFHVSTLFNIIWPIGSFYSNRTDGDNPGTLMGFGTWTSAGLGRVPIGVGSTADINAVTCAVVAETCGGEFVHTMTTAELVEHGHSFTYATFTGGSPAAGTRMAQASKTSDPVTVSVTETGSSEAFNLQQPWYSVYQWVRTA